MKTKFTILFYLIAVLSTGQTPYSHPVITVQNPHYITAFSQATNTDTNVVKSTTTLPSQYYNKNGTAAKHIVIINEGGPVQMTGGMEIDGATYTDLIGWGSSDAFGFQFLNGNISGNPVHIIGKAHDITIKGYKLVGGVNGGIWAKTENSEVQSKYLCDLSVLTTPMTHITLSCNWIQDCGGEAYYIGSTGYYGRDPLTCGGVTTHPETQKIGYIHCDSNIIINPGRTGAQMSGSVDSLNNFGTFIGNKVYYTGRELNTSQGVGLFVGGGFRNPTVTNNYVHGTFHYNYASYGYGTVIFSNNYGDSSTYWKNVHNTQALPATIFATTVAPTTWKITNNEEHGGTGVTNGHVTQYAVYPSNKNTTTGNVICGNIGNVDIIDGTLIYSDTCSVTNTPPVANAGPNGTRTLPTNTYPLTGSATDVDGTIASTVWTKLSGPTYTISNANILNPSLSNLLQGVYLFILTVTDNLGATGKDTMQLTINPAPVNNAPVANAGSDITIQLPANTIQLNGSATDDVSVASTVWSQISGTAATISNAAIINPNITNLTTAGTRTFRLIVTDGGGLKDTDDVNVNVLPAANVPPVVNAGNDTIINQPATSVTRTATASDPDGSISTYLWGNTDGCSISSGNTASLAASCTTPGPHVFSILVTDNGGATTQDQFTATFVAAANVNPTITHRNDTTVYLPKDSLIMSIVASDVDGTISNYFTYVIKTLFNARISKQNTVNPVVKQLQAGDTVIVVRRVTDDDSAYGFDTTRILVLDTTNTAPHARINRGIVTSLRLPVDQINITGAASFDNDPGDFIASYLWTQTSGATATTLVGSNGVSVNISGMTTGIYQFRLVVTDSHGATDFIDFTVTVLSKLRFKMSRL